MSPPARSVVWLLSRFLPAGEREAILGDLIEERTLRAGSGWPNEDTWFVGQLARSLVPLAWTALRRGRWIATIAAGIAAYGVVKINESVTALVWSFLPTSLTQNAIVVGLIGFSTMAFGGFLAAWMRRGAALVLASISTVMVLQWISGAGSVVPLAWQLYFLVSCPVAALTGATLVRAAKA